MNGLETSIPLPERYGRVEPASPAYRWEADVYRQCGRGEEEVFPVELAPDWEPARQYALLEAVRRGTRPPKYPGLTTEVRPVWSTKASRPVVDGLAVHAPGDSSQPLAKLGIGYLREAVAIAAGPKLTGPGLFGPGLFGPGLFGPGLFGPELFGPEPFGPELCSPESEPGGCLKYRIRAFPEDSPDRTGIAASSGRQQYTLLPETSARVTASPVSTPMLFRGGRLGSFRDRSVWEGPEPIPEDLEVFIFHDVLEAVNARIRASPGLANGGLLTGALHRDRRSPDLFLVIDGCFEVPGAERTPRSYRFTPKAWQEARRVAAKAAGEWMPLQGWFHSHTAERVQGAAGLCDDPGGRDGFPTPCLSREDRLLHRLIFPQAWTVAMLMDESPDGRSLSLFGWRDGRLVSRGFRVLFEDKAGRVPPWRRFGWECF